MGNELVDPATNPTASLASSEASAQILANEKIATGFFSLESLGRAFATSSFTQAELVGHLINDVRSLDYKARQGAARLLWQMAKDIVSVNGRIASARQTRTTTDEHGTATKVSITSFNLLERLKDIGEQANAEPHPHRTLKARTTRDILQPLEGRDAATGSEATASDPESGHGTAPDDLEVLPVDPLPLSGGSPEPSGLQPPRSLDP